MQTYTHIELADQQAAITSLPAPPRANAPVGPSGVAAPQTTRFDPEANPSRRWDQQLWSWPNAPIVADDLRFFQP